MTAIIRFDRKWLAAGADLPAGATSVMRLCAAGCNPVVWTSSNGTRWAATWGAPPTGSIAGELLIAADGTLLLFNDDEGTRLWLTTNGTTWREIVLPPDMAALGVREVVFGHGRYLAMLNNKYAGAPYTAYGESDAVWASLNGRTWVHATIPGPPAAFGSLSVDSTGFHLVGVLRQTGTTSVWTSKNGITWKVTR